MFVENAGKTVFFAGNTGEQRGNARKCKEMRGGNGSPHVRKATGNERETKGN